MLEQIIYREATQWMWQNCRRMIHTSFSVWIIKKWYLYSTVTLQSAMILIMTSFGKTKYMQVTSVCGTDVTYRSELQGKVSVHDKSLENIIWIKIWKIEKVLNSGKVCWNSFLTYQRLILLYYFLQKILKEKLFKNISNF